jgi:hypothetical protein
MKTRKLQTREAVSAQDYPFAWPPEQVVNPGRGFNWKRTVAFDFHQVCTNWVEQYVAYLNRVYKRNIDHTKISLYNLQFDTSVDLTPAEHEEAFVNFARLSRGGYGSLKAYPGIKETFKMILDAGIKIKIYTWTPGASEKIPGGAKSFGSGMAQRATMDLIASLDLGIDVDRDVKFISPSAKKWRMVEDHVPLLVEDNPETAVSVGLGIGHAVILVPEPQNAGLICPNVLRLKDRQDLGKTVVDFFAKLDEVPDLVL